MVERGTTSTQYSGEPMETPSKIISYSLVNNSAGALTVTAGAINGSTLVRFYSEPIAANESFQYNGQDIILEKGWAVYVSASGASVDFYFSIE
jgi:hypothetical protein